MAISIFENAVTQMIVNNVDKWYDGYKNVCVDYVQQAACRYKNGGHGVVDLVVHIYLPNKPCAGNQYNFEIKSSSGDLNSGNGLNLYGMYNYLVYPRSPITTLPGAITREMVEQKLASVGCDHVGIIAIVSDDDFVVERKARRYSGDGMPNKVKAHKHKKSCFGSTQCS